MSALLAQLSGVDVRLSLTLPDGTALQMPANGFLHPLWLELGCYLGHNFRSEWCTSVDSIVDEEFQRYPSAQVFYEQSEVYLYHLIAYWLEGYKRPGLSWILRCTPNMRISVLDYGCGIGADGIWLLDAGYDVSFADVPSKSLAFLRWRLAQRFYFGVPVYELTQDMQIPQHTFVYCMDVLEHLPPIEQMELLDTLATLGRFVLINLVDDGHADGAVHHPVDIDALTTYVNTRWLMAYQDFYVTPRGRVRLLCYGADLPDALVTLPTLGDKGA